MIAEPMSHSSSPPEDWFARSGSTARAHRILGTKLRFIDHPSFDDPTAPDVILVPPSESVDDAVDRPSEAPGRAALPPAGRPGARLLSRDQEAYLFRKMNYLKSRANRLKEQLDPNRPSPGDLDEIERLLSEARAVKDRIVELNLRLVVSIAKTRVGSGYGLSECVSDGTLALIKAVDGFDFARGNKFSTYATFVIRHQLARNKRRSIRLRGQSLLPYEDSLTETDSHLDGPDAEEDRERLQSAVRRWLGRLEERERRVLASHYGLGGVPRQTLTQIGQQLGISRERVRQIEDRARAKLRKWARLEGLEPLAI